MKKLLLVYPNNFLQGAMGTNNRVAQLVDIFRKIGFVVDQLGYEHFSNDSSFANFEEQNKEKIINNLYLYDMQLGYKNENNKKDSKIHVLQERIQRKVQRNIQKEYLQDWVPAGAQRLFDDVVAENDYDVIVLFYTYLANFLKGKNLRAKKIYFMEDSMFIQQYSWDQGQTQGLTIGKLMDEEIERLKFFDEIFCISNDEKIFYEKITGRYIHFLPHLLPDTYKKATTPVEQRRWDVFFIGFNNPFNVEGLDWFLDKVYPYLNKNLKILLVGSATKDIKVKYSNVDIIPFAPDLDEIYDQVKITICPMFRGTGMKIKVVEAMAKGVPVVCNERGVDGMPDKTLNGCLVTQNETEFGEYINKLCENKKFYTEQKKKIDEYYSVTYSREKYLNLLKDILYI